MDAARHYDRAYFEDQRISGEFGGRAELVKYEEFVQPSDSVLDFGCGGGFLLANLKCSDRMGVEVNPDARAVCAAMGVPVVASLDEVPDRWANVVVSNHALEHVVDPHAQLNKLRSKLKPGGKLVLCVPCERYDTAYNPEDTDKHLFTWSPMNAGHLVTLCGFRVVESRLFRHKFPPGYRHLQRFLGWPAFHLTARLWGRLQRKMTQVRVVATAN
jgi:cyclopropane fatty-acyl-phospholipid synthase-like methyltransferase